MVESYQAAVKSKNIESLIALFDSNAVVDFVGMAPTLRGKEDLRGKAAYDSTLNCRLALTVLRTSRDSVICGAEEENDWLNLAGLPPNKYGDAIFVIRNGKIKSLRFELSDSSIAALNDIMQELIPWVAENRPEEYAEMVSENGPVFSVEKARNALLLLRQWRQRPPS